MSDSVVLIEVQELWVQWIPISWCDVTNGLSLEVQTPPIHLTRLLKSNAPESLENKSYLLPGFRDKSTL